MKERTDGIIEECAKNEKERSEQFATLVNERDDFQEKVEFLMNELRLVKDVNQKFRVESNSVMNEMRVVDGRYQKQYT